MTLSDQDYARLLALRTGLRRFQRWSEAQAKAAGLTPAQHQLLLAIRGHGDPRGPTVGEVADYLLLRHHSTVELIDRADGAGLVVRARDPEDHRVVRVQLTDAGAARIEALSSLHLEELERLALRLPAAWKGLAPPKRRHGSSAGAQVERARAKVRVARVYDYQPVKRARAVLVDRLWPRGLPRSRAPFDTWLRDVAPSSDLRKWYGHAPERFCAFAERYRKELTSGPGRLALDELRELADDGDLVLLTATRDVDHSGAAVLRDVLSAA